ncbi:hypothetical protein MSPP1_003560 [Malassezia sp. CBS 17886]|nr:hypothetical protein MSPP1_003560 [Malassezia sp. CBS 17886]
MIKPRLVEDALVDLDITHVRYAHADPWGPLFALVTLSPVLILTAYVTAFLHRRETIYLNAFLGQVLCEMLNSRLKARIQQPRPTAVLGSGFGMPSSHAQFCGFFTVFWTLHLLLHAPSLHGTSARSLRAQTTDRAGAVALVLAAGAATCYSRFHLIYHTGAQIYVGLAVGALFGAVYYYATERLPRTAPRDGWIARLRTLMYTGQAGRAVRLRDSWSAWEHGAEDEEHARWLDAFRARMNPRPRSAAHDGSHPAHLRMLLLALAEADQCEAVPTAFSVGCVIAVNLPQLDAPQVPLSDAAVLEPGTLFTGYSRELPGNTHAEECALEKLRRHCLRTPEGQGDLSAARLRVPLPLLLYTTMEACSERLSGNQPCVDRILAFNADPPVTTCAWLARAARRHTDTHGATPLAHPDTALRPLRIAVVCQGVNEPEDFVHNVGQNKLRRAGVDVVAASPLGPPAALGLTCPSLSSMAFHVSHAEPTDWLASACLRMAKRSG